MPNEDSNLVFHPRSLVRHFLVWLDWANAQTDQNVRLAHMSEGKFLNVTTHISLRKHAYLNILKILPSKNENFQI